MSTDLREALRLAHERLDDDSDAYADEDLLGMLVEAVEGPSFDTIAADLRAAAAIASRCAREQAEVRQAGLACRWGEAATAALDALGRVPLPEPPEEAAAAVRDVPVDDPRAADAVELAEAKADERRHRIFLQQLANTFGGAGTETARRLEARILAHLARETEPEEGAHDEAHA